MPEETQHEPPTPRGRGAGLLIWLLGGFLIYALSPGPVARLAGPTPPSSIETFYAPLILLYDEFPIVTSFYDWYFEVWGVR